MNMELTNSPEVDALVSTIEIDNLESIVTFGAEVAEAISRASDVVQFKKDIKILSSKVSTASEVLIYTILGFFLVKSNFCINRKISLFKLSL